MGASRAARIDRRERTRAGRCVEFPVARAEFSSHRRVEALNAGRVVEAKAESVRGVRSAAFGTSEERLRACKRQAPCEAPCVVSEPAIGRKGRGGPWGGRAGGGRRPEGQDWAGQSDSAAAASRGAIGQSHGTSLRFKDGSVGPMTHDMRRFAAPSPIDGEPPRHGRILIGSMVVPPARHQARHEGSFVHAADPRAAVCSW